MNSKLARAFTLVEVLIVVIILGILAAIVVPQFASATDDAKRTGTYDQLQKIRKALAIYYVRAGNVYPNITAGTGTWGELLSPTSPYMRDAPKNTWVGGANAKQITIASTADTAYQTTYGWIWDPATGNVWAGSFDGNDDPINPP